MLKANKPIHVIGAGLAGCEAAYQIIRYGIPVILHEMRPVKSDEAHKTADFAELVCSNSLRANNLENAVGLLKEEMRRLDSLIMQQADKHQIPAGGALAVDREGFAQGITEIIKNHPLITVVYEEVTDLQQLEGYVVVASGPLTSAVLAENIKKLVEADYLNCPFETKEEYLAFWEALRTAELAPVKEFEKEVFFEACMPIEEMARRGEDTMRFGPLKPVGLVDQRTGKQAYAVVQLRQDNAAASLYNLVGFQTHLKWPEQKRVFGMIPGLENAEFVRYGVMHKNSYINSPKLLNDKFNFKAMPRFYFAGQMTGVEGYVESAASGLMAGIHTARAYLELPDITFPKETAHGALAHYISNPEIRDFQPMNVNFGLLPSLGKKIRNKKEKNALIAERSLNALQDVLQIIK